jgi:hypothetical protein
VSASRIIDMLTVPHQLRNPAYDFFETASRGDCAIHLRAAASVPEPQPRFCETTT